MKWNLFDGGASLASQHQAEINQQSAAEKLARFDQAVPVDLEEAKCRLSYNIINHKAKLSSIRKAEEAACPKANIFDLKQRRPNRTMSYKSRLKENTTQLKAN